MFDDTPPTLLEATRDEHECQLPRYLTPTPQYLEEAVLDASYLAYTAANARQGSEEPNY